MAVLQKSSLDKVPLVAKTPILPVFVPNAAGLIAGSIPTKGILKLEVNESKLMADLNEAWEVLAEPIQTVMRRYGVENPYEKLKELTRGHNINKKSVINFIESLDIPEIEKKNLLPLTPHKYFGLASKISGLK